MHHMPLVQVHEPKKDLGRDLGEHVLRDLANLASSVGGRDVRVWKFGRV